MKVYPLLLLSLVLNSCFGAAQEQRSYMLLQGHIKHQDTIEIVKLLNEDTLNCYHISSGISLAKREYDNRCIFKPLKSPLLYITAGTAALIGAILFANETREICPSVSANTIINLDCDERAHATLTAARGTAVLAGLALGQGLGVDLPQGIKNSYRTLKKPKEQRAQEQKHALTIIEILQQKLDDKLEKENFAQL